MNDSLELPLCIFKNSRDNHVSEVYTVSWGELKDVFSTHAVRDKKDGEAFQLTLFKPPSGLAPDELVDHCTRRLRKNVLEYYALHLDFDATSTIDDAAEHFKDLEYFLYTSYNHLRTPGIHKYRVILPFNEPCPIDELVARTDSIREWVAPLDHDESSFAISRLFYTPSTDAAGLEHATSRSNSGLLLPWDIFEPKVQPVREPRKGLSQGQQQTLNTRIFAELEVLAAQGAFDEELEWFKLGGALFSASFDLADFQALSFTDAAAACAKKWAHWNHNPPQMNAGYLVNLIRRTNPGFLMKATRTLPDSLKPPPLAELIKALKDQHDPK